MPFIIVTIILSCILALTLPWHSVRHFILSYGLGIALLCMLLPPVHISDLDFGHAIVMAILTALLIVIGLPLLIRLCWAIHRGTCDYTIKSRLDHAMGLITGAVLGLIGFILLSYLLAGTPMILAHGIALSLAIFLGLKRHPVNLTMAACFVVLTCYSLTYPHIVRSAAKEVAPKSYAISSPNPDVASDLTFLSMAKFPHPRIHFEQDGKPVTLGWSYRRRAFLPIWH